jgi:hypothetical protein
MMGGIQPNWPNTITLKSEITYFVLNNRELLLMKYVKNPTHNDMMIMK